VHERLGGVHEGHVGDVVQGLGGVDAGVSAPDDYDRRIDLR
jgi:hypothetical protein